MPIPLPLPYPARSTPMPNALLDTWMPRLSDTELRVLLVVTRQTLGFQASANSAGIAARRARDWITHSQLKQKTGWESAAVSRAIDGLVKEGLLQVCTQAGAPLPTPQERRRYPGKLFFSLNPSALVEAAGADNPVDK